MMENTFSAIKKLRGNPQLVYFGEGVWEEQTLEATGPLVTLPQLKDVEDKYDIVLPEDYKKFLLFSNGLRFYKDNPENEFVTIQEAVKTSLALESFDEEKIIIGYFFMDSIAIDCTSGKDRVYFSEEGIEDFKPLTNFKYFLDAMVSFNGRAYWITDLFKYFT